MKWFLLSADLYNNLNVPDAGTQRNGNSTKQKSADVLKIIFLMQDASFIKNIILSLFRLSSRRERKSKFSLFSVSEVEFSLLDSVLLTPPAWVAVSRDPCLFATLIPNNPLKVKPLLVCQSVPCQCVLWGCREACVQLTSFSAPSLCDAFGWSAAAALVAVVPEPEFSSSRSLRSSPDNEPPVHG